MIVDQFPRQGHEKAALAACLRPLGCETTAVAPNNRQKVRHLGAWTTAVAPNGRRADYGTWPAARHRQLGSATRARKAPSAWHRYLGSAAVEVLCCGVAVENGRHLGSETTAVAPNDRRAVLYGT